MAKNIDDIDDSIGSLNAELNKFVRQFQEATGKIEIGTKAFEKRAQDILGINEIDKKFSADEKKWKSAQIRVIQDYVKNLGNITALDYDYEKILKLRLKASDEFLKNEKKSLAERKNVNDSILKATLLEHEAHVRHIDAIDQATKAYGKTTSQLSSAVGKVPFLGEYLSKSLEKHFDRPDVKEKLMASMTSKIEGGGMGGKALGMLAGSGEGAATMGGALGAGAMVAGLAALALLAGMLVKLFMSLVKLELEFNSALVKSVGISSQFAGKMEGVASAARASAVAMGLTPDEAQKISVESTAALFREYGNVSNVTKANVEMTFAISKYMGVSTEESAKFVRYLNSGLKMSTEQSKQFLLNIKSASDIAGVSTTQVMADIAHSSNQVASFWHGTTDQLGKAAVHARLIGSSLKEQLNTAESFATFEQAAENSMTLQVLGLGKFNALQMYTMANYGDASKLQDMILKGLKDEHKWNSMNVTSRRELAKILGVEVNQVMELVHARKAESELRAEMSGKGLGKLAESELGRGAYRRLRATGGAIDKASVEKEMADMKAATGTMDAKIASTAMILGLGEQLDPMARAEAAIYSWLTETLQPAVLIIKDGVVRIVEMLVNFFGGGGPAPKGGISPVTFKVGGLNINPAAGQGFGGGAGSFDYYTTAGAPALQGKASGGIVNEPVIAGEAGPEAILPLSGKGKQNFTVPFLRSVKNSGGGASGQNVDRLIELLSQLLSQPIQITTRVNVDGREIAKSLTERGLVTG